MEDVKARLRTALEDVLANPQVAAAARLRVRVGGILLHGPPGNGKSFLARATAGEFRLGYLPITGDALVEDRAGDAPGRLRQLFEQARQRVPCLLFLDDIDAIVPADGASPNEARRLSIRAALIECLGSALETPGLVVMAATDRLDLLDPAIVAGGRLSEHIEIPALDREARERLLRLYSRKMPLEPTVDLHKLAEVTEDVVVGVDSLKVGMADRRVRPARPVPRLLDT
jgi:transitional endoplasmic reticulum ATPase